MQWKSTRLSRKVELLNIIAWWWSRVFLFLICPACVGGLGVCLRENACCISILFCQYRQLCAGIEWETNTSIVMRKGERQFTTKIITAACKTGHRGGGGKAPRCFRYFHVYFFAVMTWCFYAVMMRLLKTLLRPKTAYLLFACRRKKKWSETGLAQHLPDLWCRDRPCTVIW